ncbi:beta-lactamase [Cryobacterium roopkundense]|uniref:Beta-lactamase n=1 Tax=Cryobacterium roopkundense TaxID=1001240 RepID=A0A099J2K2_9MICO|nr:hypothetical protein [Cryobacterium roopkundense]KGJ72310.1 beta-lactamase [Cryobacterium roopkundense]MBB5639905.1 hypothetical protein [Cryobacterium roopkundense]
MTALDLLADVRTGDKGSTLILAVLPRDDEAYSYLLSQLTGEVVSAHFGALVTGLARRTALPQLPGFVFELPGVLGGGVTGSPSLDGHGKTLSYHLLSLEV